MLVFSSGMTTNYYDNFISILVGRIPHTVASVDKCIIDHIFMCVTSLFLFSLLFGMVYVY